MKTVTEKYRAIKAGKLTEGEFVRQMRLAHPTLITQFNGYKDTVQILKNKGMLFEEEYKTINISDDSVRRGIRYELTSMGIDPSGKVKSEDLEKAKKKATDNVTKDPLHYYNLLSGESSKVDKHDKYQEVKKNNHKDTFNDMKKADLKEDVEKELGASDGEISDLVKNEKHIKDKLDKAGKKYSKSYSKDKHGQKIVVFKLKENLNEGTRAMIGYVSGDRLTTTYNHYDGYPSNLGKGLMTFYNDDEKAKDIAMKGYITGMDADTGEISATHSDPPTKIKLPEDGEEMAREVAEEIDGMGADYGYIWHDESNQWLTIKNTGIRSMIDQITGKMGVDTEVEEDIIPADEAVAEPTLKERLREALSDPAKLKIAKAIKAKYPIITARDIDTFLNMHGKDIENGADPMDEFEEFFHANYDSPSDMEEKKGKDHDGDGDIDSDDYMAAKDKAIKKAMGKEVDELKEYSDDDDEQEWREEFPNAIKYSWEWDDEGVGAVDSYIDDLFSRGAPEISKEEAMEMMGRPDDETAKAFNQAFITQMQETDDTGGTEMDYQYTINLLYAYEKTYGEPFNTKLIKFLSPYKDAKPKTYDEYKRHISKLLGKDLNESVVKNNIKSIITKILEEEVINEAATNDLAKIAEDYGDFEGLKPAIIALQNIVTEIESFYDKTRGKIQKIYNDLGEVRNEEGLKVGAFIAPSIENAFKRDLRPITKQQFHGGLEMPKVKRISESDPVMRKPDVTQMEAPKETVFTPVNEKKNKNGK